MPTSLADAPLAGNLAASLNVIELDAQIRFAGVTASSGHGTIGCTI